MSRSLANQRGISWVIEAKETVHALSLVKKKKIQCFKGAETHIKPNYLLI